MGAFYQATGVGDFSGGAGGNSVFGGGAHAAQNGSAGNVGLNGGGGSGAGQVNVGGSVSGAGGGAGGYVETLIQSPAATYSYAVGAGGTGGGGSTASGGAGGAGYIVITEYYV